MQNLHHPKCFQQLLRPQQELGIARTARIAEPLIVFCVGAIEQQPIGQQKFRQQRQQGPIQKKRDHHKSEAPLLSLEPRHDVDRRALNDFERLGRGHSSHLSPRDLERGFGPVGQHHPPALMRQPHRVMTRAPGQIQPGTPRGKQRHKIIPVRIHHKRIRLAMPKFARDIAFIPSVLSRTRHALQV